MTAIQGALFDALICSVAHNYKIHDGAFLLPLRVQPHFHGTLNSCHKREMTISCKAQRAELLSSTRVVIFGLFEILHFGQNLHIKISFQVNQSISERETERDQEWRETGPLSLQLRHKTAQPERLKKEREKKLPYMYRPPTLIPHLKKQSYRAH